MTTKPIVSSQCCPAFDPASWDEKTFVWDNKKCAKKYGKNYVVIVAEVE